jgi:hypothetical protein
MNGQPQPYQSLTSENAALVLVAHQVGLVTGVHSGHNARTHGQVRGPDPSGKKMLEISDDDVCHRSHAQRGFGKIVAIIIGFA